MTASPIQDVLKNFPSHKLQKEDDLIPSPKIVFTGHFHVITHFMHVFSKKFAIRINFLGRCFASEISWLVDILNQLNYFDFNDTKAKTVISLIQEWCEDEIDFENVHEQKN